MNRITLLTDFGTADGYVAAMKGVIASITPDVIVDDVAHDIPPGDVRAAAWALARYWRHYPAGTVHVAVVDPGVGSARRALAAQIDDRFIVAPDNGILTVVLDRAADSRLHAIKNISYMRDTVSSTFHGRDVFAPCAARLAAGASLEDVGARIDDPISLNIPRALAEPEGMRGAVVAIDRFGNLITNIAGDWARGSSAHLNGREIGRVRQTYADVAAGEAVALIGSDDYLEIAVRDGNAAKVLRAGIGAEVCTRNAS